MKPLLTTTLFLFLFLTLTPDLSAQARLNFFVDCECNKTLLKQEINYVNHALDPARAQVNLFIVTNYLSNGGRVYNLQFKGQHELAGNLLGFKVPTTAIMTGREIDEELTKRIQLGLAGFLAGTPYAALAAVEVDVESEEEIEEETVEDAWNGWIFDVTANYRSNSESQRSFSELRLRLEADRTTPEWRLRANTNYLTSTRRARQSDGSELVGEREDIWANGSVVRSISDHFSVGMFGSATTSTFRNIDYGIWVAPAIEYNFFNYDKVPFKEFTIAYRMAWTRNDYTERTIFLQTEENLMRQSVDLNLRLRQRWGRIFAGVSGGHYLQDFAMNRISMNLFANVRVFRGLSFNVGGNYEIINDQISLPLGDASVEDILLGQSQLATSFESSVRFGLSYTFGSLFNNVVNTRL